MTREAISLRVTIIPNGTHTDYLSYDGYDRVGWVVHYFNGTSRSFNYGYDDAHNTNNRLWTRRLGTVQGDIGDAFSYDLADQAVGVQINVPTPQNVNQPITPQNIIYDTNGNRQWYTPTGISKEYEPPPATPSHAASNLNQYTSVKINGTPYNLTYRADANLATYGNNNATYNYDAQNRLTSATVGGVTYVLRI